MKKLLLTFSGLLGAFLALSLAIALLWPKAAPSDPPELAQAKLSAQLQEVQRQQQSADFWNHFLEFSAIAFVVAILITIGVIIYWYSRSHAHAHRLEVARLRRSLQLIEADPLGNYPAWLDQQSGEYIRLRPGNSPVARPPANFVLGNSPVAQVKERGNGRDTMPLVVQTYNRQPARPGEYKVSEIQPAELGQPDPARAVRGMNPEPGQVNPVQVGAEPSVEPTEFEPGAEPLNLEPEPDFQELLAEAKSRGESASSAIPRITGCARNGKEPWRTWKTIWDSLPEAEGVI